jgi:hypothetical protein
MDAKEFIIRSGYTNEIDWQEERNFNNIAENEFLAEVAWVVLSSGMRVTVIEKIFDQISRIFYDWILLDKIVEDQSFCRKMALKVFNNPKKIDAIIYFAEHISKNGFESVQCEIGHNGVEYLMTFPFLGPATAFHLAKNIGLPVVKPDRHLVRVAQVAGYQSPMDLCRDIADYISEDIAVVDLVIWRYATLCKDYLDLFTPVSYVPE